MTQGSFYVQVAIWSQVASAVFFVAVLVYIWARWLQPMALAAQARSNEQVAEAERHRDEAKAALETLRGEIASAEHDAQLIRERARKHAQRVRQEALEETRVAGERSLRSAEGELARARESARTRLRAEYVRRALLEARDEAQRRIDATANGKIVERFLATLEKAPR